MKVNNRTIIITDPCYILKKGDKNSYAICTEGLPSAFSDYIVEPTIYGDWSCTTYVGNNLNIPIGQFCADAGEVCVVYVDELIEYNPKFFAEHGTWTYTVIPHFTGEVQYEVDKDNNAHIVGYREGKISFYTTQTGL